MKIGYIFPGQGSQYVGMGKDIFNEFQEVKEMFDLVEKLTKKDVAKMCFEGVGLDETKNTQICILTLSLGILEILNRRNIKSQMSAGLSLGEYTALINSNFLNLEQGIQLVTKRGKIMQNNLPDGEFVMVSVLGLDENVVEQICANMRNENFVVIPSNYNTKQNVVVSVELVALKKFEEICYANGCKKVMKVKTQGPFHTKLMESARIKFEQELKKEFFNLHDQTKYPQVIKNIDAKPYCEKDDCVQVLSQHLTNPVLFSESLKYMIQNGVDTFVEIGPNKILSGFVKRMLGKDELIKVKILNTNNLESLNKTLEVLKGE